MKLNGFSFKSFQGLRWGRRKNYRTTHLKCYYDEIGIFPIQAILNNKTVQKEKYLFPFQLSAVCRLA